MLTMLERIKLEPFDVTIGLVYHHKEQVTSHILSLLWISNDLSFHIYIVHQKNNIRTPDTNTHIYPSFPIIHFDKI